MDVQLKRGLLEVCVLAVLEREDSYGYKIVKDVSECIDISESTLYPILKRLEGNGCLSVYSVEHNSRLRKYYQITRDGKAKLKEFLGEWKTMTAIYEFIKASFHEEENSEPSKDIYEKKDIHEEKDIYEEDTCGEIQKTYAQEVSEVESVTGEVVTEAELSEEERLLEGCDQKQLEEKKREVMP